MQELTDVLQAAGSGAVAPWVVALVFAIATLSSKWWLPLLDSEAKRRSEFADDLREDNRDIRDEIREARVYCRTLEGTLRAAQSEVTRCLTERDEIMRLLAERGIQFRTADPVPNPKEVVDKQEEKPDG
jgi:hypothetical protein